MTRGQAADVTDSPDVQGALFVGDPRHERAHLVGHEVIDPNRDAATAGRDVYRGARGTQLHCDPASLRQPEPLFLPAMSPCFESSHLPGSTAYSISVSVPVAISAAAQIRSRLIQARRSMPTPSFSNTSTAMNAVTAR